MPERTPEKESWNRQQLLLLCGLATVSAIAVTALLVDIVEHKQEARNPFYRVVDLNDTVEDPAVWGKNFPMQFDMYLRTVDMKRTLYGGSEAMPHAPTEADPRTVVARSKLEQDPRLKEMWAGDAFSKDYRERRGHAYMLDDQTFTERQQVVKQPGTCLNCHASMYTIYMKLGNGDMNKGFDAINHMPYSEARKYAQHPVSCIDCHEPKSMALRVTRPAFMEGMRNLKASEGIANYDVNTMATRQEMRSFVCGQCHVEYYFQGPEKKLVFPSFKGRKVDQIVAYYQEIKFKDWLHADTGAPMLKVQHPEFELWSQGIHSRSGVACADCHMPYTREGGLKISDHHVRSPLLNINRACRTCHRWPEEELKSRVEEIQTRYFNLRNEAMDALVDLIHDIKQAKEAGADDAELEGPRDFQRQASFYIDFVMSENSIGCHADGECLRVLGDAINLCRKAQLALPRGNSGKAQISKAAYAAPQGK
jgi:nitrite reductase (cytochrome c-552)